MGYIGIGIDIEPQEYKNIGTGMEWIMGCR
jgi:hypothetical protein